MAEGAEGVLLVLTHRIVLQAMFGHAVLGNSSRAGAGTLCLALLLALLDIRRVLGFVIRGKSFV
jgi:hypothetical protein